MTQQEAIELTEAKPEQPSDAEHAKRVRQEMWKQHPETVRLRQFLVNNRDALMSAARTGANNPEVSELDLRLTLSGSRIFDDALNAVNNIEALQ